VLAGLIVIVGTTVALRGAARELHRPTAGGPPPLQFMGFVLAGLFVFAILVGAALLLRRRRDWHKRLMLLSCLSMTGPGLTRIPPEWFRAFAFLKTGGLAGLFGLDLLLVYVCIAWDTWRHRRLHPAFVCGTLLIVAYDLPFIWIFLSSSTWTHFATPLVS
jgi:magnesium-transporting ATPase (P-type)